MIQYPPWLQPSAQQPQLSCSTGGHSSDSLDYRHSTFVTSGHLGELRINPFRLQPLTSLIQILSCHRNSPRASVFDLARGLCRLYSRHLCEVDPHSKHLGSLFERLIGLSSLSGSVGGALSVLWSGAALDLRVSLGGGCIQTAGAPVVPLLWPDAEHR